MKYVSKGYQISFCLKHLQQNNKTLSKTNWYFYMKFYPFKGHFYLQVLLIDEIKHKMQSCH